MAMVKSEQVLCDSSKPGEAGRYRLLDCLGRSPGRQTWRALDLATVGAAVDWGAVDSGAVRIEGAGSEGQGSEGTGSKGAASEGADSNWQSPEGGPAEAAGETVIVKLLAFSDEIDWGQVKLFEREAAVLKGLQHPALPRYRDSFSLEERLLWFGLVQDDIPGQSLDQWLGGGAPPLSELELRQWAAELLEILIYLHGQSPPILHRDIKPSNIIWGDDQRIYLIDLGAAQNYAAQASLGSSFTVVGTYGYAPLEQFGGRAVPASDLYALGATLIHLLTGIAPADLPQQDLRLQFEADVSPGFRRWLQQLTEPDVQRRIPTAQAALAALGQCSQSPPTPPFPWQSGQLWPQLRSQSRSQPRSGQPLPSPPGFEQPPRQPAFHPTQPNPAAPHGAVQFQQTIPAPSAVELLEPPPLTASAALVPAGARMRLKRSPDLLLVELPGEELGYVFAFLGVGFTLWGLLTSSVTLPFSLLFTLLGIFWAAPQVLRFERQGHDISFSLGKPLGGYLLRLGRRQARSGVVRQIFHRLQSPKPSGGLDRGGLQSNRRSLVVQTHRHDIAISTNLNWQEGTWLVEQIYAWCDGR